MESVNKFSLSREFLDMFRRAVEARDDSLIVSSIAELNHIDVSEILHEFDSEDSKYVLDLLEEPVGAAIINDLDEDDRSRFLKVFKTEEIARYLEHLDSDDIVDILSELSPKIREEAILKIGNEEKVASIVELIKYDEDSAGGLMAAELIKANVNWTVIQTIDEIRRQASNVQKIYSVYVVDDLDKLMGRVSLKGILLANDTTKIQSLYEGEILSVPSYMSSEEVASIMRKYDLEAVPVIDLRGKLLGRITIDDVVDVIAEQAEEERQLMSGISADVEEDDSIWMISKARLPWLIIGLAGGLIGAQFIGVFEEDLKKITAIAFFIPLIIATGGNVGIQSSALVVQSLANKSAIQENNVRKLLRVLLVALINAVLLSGLVYIFILVINQSDFKLATVVSSALFSVVVLASFLGTLIPIVLERFGVNPALASGPFITTAIDLLGLAVYFSVVHLLYAT